MITEQNKKLAEWAMEFALKNGCQAARVNIYTNSNSSTDLRNGKIDSLKRASEAGMSFSLYVDGRFGSYSTNRLDKAEIEQFIKKGIDATRYLAKDEFRQLPDPARYYQGGGQDLQLYDPEVNSLDPDEKVKMALQASEEVMGKDSRIVSVDASFGDRVYGSYLLASNGFQGESTSSECAISASVSIKGEGDARPSSYWYDSSLFFADLIKNGIGEIALERTLKKLGQKKVQSGKYTMVLDPMNSSRVLSPLLSALQGASIQQKNSFLIDKLGQKVGSDLLVLRDEPHLVKAFGARYYDGEGVATTPRTVFDKGVLHTYYIDTYYALKMGVSPTIASSSTLILEPGAKDLEGLIRDIHNGILVTGFNGGNSNSSTGDFSFGIEGYLIENGKTTQPISEMNITGNLVTLWKSLVGVGNDPRLNSSWRIPSLVFEGVDFSGL